jgi:glycosyltransferase involved in cell wall biosynthesis
VFLLFFRFFLPKLKIANLLIASADKQKIGEFHEKNKNHLYGKEIVYFPTRINTLIFRKKERLSIRKQLNFPNEKKIIVTSGRLGWFKGWKFMIDSFQIFRKNNPDSHMFFIGDGEDKLKIIEYIQNEELENFVHLLGYLSHEKLSNYLNASDLFIMGSYNEGWSTSLVEAVACGVPCCVTNFSSAKEIITEGKDGFIAEKHDVILFSNLMNKALLIDREPLPDESKILKFSKDNLKNDLMSLWELR